MLATILFAWDVGLVAVVEDSVAVGWVDFTEVEAGDSAEVWEAVVDLVAVVVFMRRQVAWEVVDLVGWEAEVWVVEEILEAVEWARASAVVGWKVVGDLVVGWEAVETFEERAKELQVDLVVAGWEGVVLDKAIVG